LLQQSGAKLFSILHSLLELLLRDCSGGFVSFRIRLCVSLTLLGIRSGLIGVSGDGAIPIRFRLGMDKRRKSERFTKEGSRKTEGAVSSRVDRRSMKYKTRITTETTNAAININFAVSAVVNARTPSPRNPIMSTTIEDSKA
jgi:hypothetical protein